MTDDNKNLRVDPETARRPYHSVDPIHESIQQV